MFRRIIVDSDPFLASCYTLRNSYKVTVFFYAFQDLVKSHLMFAVHEEVEVLKEQIKDLTVKNAQLEYENEILRASASPETLAQLDAGGHALVQGNPNSPQPSDYNDPLS